MKGYLAVVLNERSSELIKKEAIYDSIYCHHVTLKFGVTKREVASYLGTKVDIISAGFVKNDKVQCLDVYLNSPIRCDYKFPHITISTKGVSPKYSNGLERLTRIPYTKLLKGIIEFIPFNA